MILPFFSFWGASEGPEPLMEGEGQMSPYAPPPFVATTAGNHIIKTTVVQIWVRYKIENTEKSWKLSTHQLPPSTYFKQLIPSVDES